MEVLNVEVQEKIYKDLSIKEKNYSNTEKMNIIGIEVLTEDLPNIQFFKNVEMVIEYPITEVKFEKKNSIQALVFAQAKTQWGYSDVNNFECFLNNKFINKIDFKNFEDYKKIIKDYNILTIRFKSKINLNYFLQIKITDEELIIRNN